MIKPVATLTHQERTVELYFAQTSKGKLYYTSFSLDGMLTSLDATSLPSLVKKIKLKLDEAEHA